MLKSMTGYGRGEITSNGRHIVFEIKSVNHKFFEFSSRLPRNCLFLEDKLKSFIQSKVARGKVDVFLQMEMLDADNVEVQINHGLADGYIAALRELQSTYQLADAVSLTQLARFSDIFTVQKTPEDEETIWQAVLQAGTPALDAFLAMRETEGHRLFLDLLEKADRLEELVSQVELCAPETVRAYRERLKEKIEELVGENRFDEQRLLTEVAIFADHVAVDEETVRLRSHIKQLRSLAEVDGPVGRKIDFLVQEMNRETNTIGSKSQNTDIAYLVVDMKSEIEKIREQVQNLE